jgi:2-(1,2-epoxy-1,2-dihydrophenyl)acetyl-CoA isomerase
MSAFIELQKDGPLVLVALNRPDAYNAFNYEMVAGLAENLTVLAADDRVKGVILTGRGKAFCAGGDLKWALGFKGRPGAAFHQLASQFHAAVLEIRRMKKPVVAAINGMAAGGGFSLALACDFRIIAKSAILKQAYTSAALCIDGGGTFNLPRLVGLARAMEIAAFDEPISSSQALEWGLATKVVEDGQVLDEARTMIQKLIQRSIHSFAITKKLLTDSFETSFETQMELERDGLSACADHPDGREGLKAFAEKRKPQFKST